MSHALLLHSWLRWLVVGAALVVLVESARELRRHEPRWLRRHARWIATLAGLAKLQLVVGIVLVLWLSPIARAAWSAGFATMIREPVLVFFGLVHPILMVVGVGVLDVGRARSSRETASRDKQRILAKTASGWLAIAVLAIPWPFLPWGRPLARFDSVDAGAPGNPTIPATFVSRCASCHGSSGNADGPLAPTLSPRPRAFRDPVWQRTVTDDDLRAIIREGGSPRDKSPLMPAHRDLTPATIDELVRYIRVLDDLPEDAR